MPDDNTAMHDACEPPWSLRSLAPLLLATGSLVLLGYLLGCSSYRKDLVETSRAVKQPPVPVEIRVREVL